MPNEYEKIFIYDDYQRTMKNGIQDAKTNAFAFPGFYIKIVVNNLNFNILANHPPSKPLVNLTEIHRNNHKIFHNLNRLYQQILNMKEKSLKFTLKLRNGAKQRI